MDEVLGRYRLGGRIAAGALGTVVAATDLRTQQEVAVKFFDGATDNFSAWTRELRLAIRLRHPHIAPCLDAGLDAGTGLSVLVFARALGGSLRRTVAAGRRLAPEEVRRLLDEIAAALEHAHAHGVVHRDIKPENILARDRCGEPPWLLTDFGSGLFLARGTKAHTLAGSLPYMGPEVFGRATDARCDLYALGVVAVEVMAGAVPDLAQRSGFRLAPRRGIEAIAAWLLAPDPERRPASAAALRLVLAGMDERWDATRAGGAAWLLAGEQVSIDDASAIRRVCRVGRARRFINLHGESTAIVAAERRVAVLTPEGARTIVAAERPFEALTAGVGCGAWTLEGGSIVAIAADGGRRKLHAALPDGWYEGLAAGARATGAVLGPDTAVLGVVGRPELLWVQRVERAIVARVLAAEAGLWEFVRAGERALALCGDAGAARLYEVDPAGGLVPRAHAATAVDAARLVFSGPGVTMEPWWPCVAVRHDSDSGDRGGDDGG